MVYTMRVSLPGKDALRSNNTDDYALYADEDNVLIKEKLRGSVSVSNGNTGTIDHGLGYVPMAFCMAEVSTGRWVYVLAESGDYSVSMALTTSQLLLSNSSGSTVNFKYYIFYDFVI